MQQYNLLNNNKLLYLYLYSELVTKTNTRKNENNFKSTLNYFLT